MTSPFGMAVGLLSILGGLFTNFEMCVLLITRLMQLVGRWARKPVNHTSWVALVTPTDRPKSVRNRCLIELFCDVVCVVTCPFDISVGVGAFVIGLGQISSFCLYIRSSPMYYLSYH